LHNSSSRNNAVSEKIRFSFKEPLLIIYIKERLVSIEKVKVDEVENKN
jgi:hypothetical protein